MSIISKKMRQLTWYPCEKLPWTVIISYKWYPLHPQRLPATKGTQRSSKERDSNARRIRTTPWFVGSDWFFRVVFNDKVVNLLFQQIPQKSKKIKQPQSQSHIPNPGFLKVQRKNTTSEVTEGVRNQHCNQLRMKLKARAIFAKRKSRTTPTLKPAFMPPMIST